MKKFLTLVCVSALGGAMTLGAYKQFFEDSSSNKVGRFIPKQTKLGLPKRQFEDISKKDIRGHYSAKRLF